MQRTKWLWGVAIVAVLAIAIYNLPNAGATTAPPDAGGTIALNTVETAHPDIGTVMAPAATNGSSTLQTVGTTDHEATIGAPCEMAINEAKITAPNVDQTETGAPLLNAYKQSQDHAAAQIAKAAPTADIDHHNRN